jgi:Type II secretion system (T2SS), protein E, N-terminal domain
MRANPDILDTFSLAGKHHTIMAVGSGALLLRAGVLRPDQVAQAVALRQREGGSFGECLIRTGAISEDSLVEFYHKRLMIPRINAAKLDHIPLKVIALVPADMAAEFRAIPVEIDGEGNVTLAMADPSDNHAVDEVAFFLDRFVVRAVAAESAVRRAIERYYGVRFMSPRTDGQRLVEANSGAPQPAPRSPPPASRKELFQKPSRAELEEQIVLLTKVKHSDATPLPMPVPPPDDFEPSYAADDEPLPEDPAADEVPTLAEDDEIPTTDPEIPAVGTPEEPILLTKPISQPEPETRKKRSTLPGFPALTVPDPPLADLRAAGGRDEIARAVLDYFSQLAGRVIFFAVKKALLVGHDARGDIDPVAIRHLAISLEAPSLFRDVVASRLPYRGPLPETVGNLGFARAIGGVETDVLLMPIAIRDRIVALLYADHTRQPLPSAALHATTREAGLAYERLILEAKGR